MIDLDNLDYSKDLDWDTAIVTPLGRLYGKLMKAGFSKRKTAEIIRAVIDSGAYNSKEITDAIEKEFKERKSKTRSKDYETV
jgi:glycerol kinase